MPGLDPGIQFLTAEPEGWIAGSSPAMTPGNDPVVIDPLERKGALGPVSG